MIGLLLKDMYCLKQNGKSLLFILFIWGIVFLPQSDGGLLLIYLCMMISSMHVLTLSTYDRQAQWDMYALSMPLTRTNMVQEKYIMSLFMLAGSATISAALVGIAWMIRTGGLSGVILLSIISAMTVGAAMSLFYTAIALPTSMWLGEEKARYIPSVLFAAIFFTGITIARTGRLSHVTLSGMNQFGILALCVSFLIFAASYVASLSIYKKKEF